MSKLIIVNLSTCFPFFITITTLKRCLVHLYLQLFVGGLMLCNCFVFLRLLCPMLPVSLDCPMLIVPSVFSNVYTLRLKCSGKQTLPSPRNYFAIIILKYGWRRVWRYQRGNQNLYTEEEQTTQWSKGKIQKTNNDLQNIHIKLKIE